MNAFRTFLFMLLVSIAVGITLYFSGVKSGAEAERVKALKGEIINNLHLLRVAESRDFVKLTNDLQFLIFASTESFKKLKQPNADPDFESRLSQAVWISEMVRTGMVTFSETGLIKALNPNKTPATNP